jgi:acetate kinase
MTPQSGLPQNNRVGDMDVFALFYAVKHCGIGLDRAEDILASEAGLKGMSGLASGDMRDLKAAAASGNARAREALDVYTACIRKFIGQFLVEMNGADVIAFAGGIGENNPDLREEVCRDMDFCGLALDKARNESAKGTEAVISVDGSKIEARAILTNEELIIARNAWVKCNEFG